jgi:uncharacterized repeat protein (TIGR03803 family)
VRFRTLHEFHEADGVVASITGPLVKGTDGRLYGVTAIGGEFGNGALFSITRRGEFSLLYSFTGGVDGAQPNTLFRDPEGHIYGATAFRTRARLRSAVRRGRDGTLTVVHNFMGLEGGQVNGSMMQFKQGSFYGTTATGGDVSSGNIYRFTPPSTVESIYDFGFNGRTRPVRTSVSRKRLESSTAPRATERGAHAHGRIDD